MITSSPTATISFTDLYVRVQQFYAGQVRQLDGMHADAFAATFTEDGLFNHAPGVPPLRGRHEIAGEMRAHQERVYGANPAQRRHWFNMLEIFPRADGSILTEYYALVLVTRPGERVPVVAPSCFVRDVLVLRDGELLTYQRKVVPDYAA